VVASVFWVVTRQLLRCFGWLLGYFGRLLGCFYAVTRVFRAVPIFDGCFGVTRWLTVVTDGHYWSS